MAVDPVLESTRAEESRLQPDPSVNPAPSVHRVERRPLGVPPLPLLGGLTLGALVLSIVLWSVVGWIPGFGLLVVTVALAGLFWAGVRKQPESRTSRTLAGLTVRTRDGSAFLAAGTRTWSRTGARVVSLRWRRLQLKRELHHRLRPLGDAVHQGDEARAETLKSETADLQQRLDELGAREQAVVSSARSEIERDRAPVQPTQAFGKVEPDEESSPDGRRRISA